MTKTAEDTCKAPLTKTYTAIDCLNKTVTLPNNEQIGKTISKTEGSSVDHEYVSKKWGYKDVHDQWDIPGYERNYGHGECEICGKNIGEYQTERIAGNVMVDNRKPHTHTACKWCKKLKPGTK